MRTEKTFFFGSFMMFSLGKFSAYYCLCHLIKLPTMDLFYRYIDSKA